MPEKVLTEIGSMLALHSQSTTEKYILAFVQWLYTCNSPDNSNYDLLHPTIWVCPVKQQMKRLHVSIIVTLFHCSACSVLSAHSPPQIWVNSNYNLLKLWVLSSKKTQMKRLHVSIVPLFHSASCPVLITVESSARLNKMFSTQLDLLSRRPIGGSGSFAINSVRLSE